MILYLTFNDLPSGIYNSQVIDVVKSLNELSPERVRLFSVISLRGYWQNKAKIKARMPDAIVVPMFPSLKNWRMNNYLFGLYCFFVRPKAIIGRSVFATTIALFAKRNRLTKKVCYDGRGAIMAEWKEYNVVSDEQLKSEIAVLEKAAVNDVDYSIAVSQKLVEYWQREFGYTKDRFQIIPCTFSSEFNNKEIVAAEIVALRQQLQLTENDIVLVYSGSISGWQSFEMLRDFLSPLLTDNLSLKVIFYAKSEKNSEALMKQFPLQVKCIWVDHSEMPAYLMAGDYGLLIRENTVTNQVASPVKFAEYLACGLSVLISSEIGDYSTFVEKNNCGTVVRSNTVGIVKQSIADKNRCMQLANANFSKNAAAIQSAYKTILQALNNP